MKFDILRLFLVERETPDLFPDRTMPTSREEWLKSMFSKEIAFAGRGNSFVFTPGIDTVDDPALLYGRIGRKLVVNENEPPERGLKEIRRDAWKAAFVIIDPRHHGDGQKVAFQSMPSIGRPVSVFKYLVDHLNTTMTAAPYVLEVNSVTDVQDFIDFAKKYKGRVSSVQFEFVAPNMFGSAEEIDKEIRDLRDHEKAHRVTLSLQNDDGGLDLETEKIRSAAEYTSKGGGFIRARTKSNQRYDSADRGKHFTVGSPTGAILDTIKEAVNLLLSR